MLSLPQTHTQQELHPLTKSKIQLSLTTISQRSKAKMTIPPYTLRYSQKAKYLQVRISTKGLEVVVPGLNHVPQTVIDKFLQQKKAWIVRHWQRLLHLSEKQVMEPLELPESIVLQAIGQRWEVVYVGTGISKVRCIENQSRQIKLLGNITNHINCIRSLKEWLKTIALKHLREQIELLALEYGLPFSQLTLRYTKTRWGSCSSHKNISLCCRLLFLPPHLVKHVLLHELCHTKVMSHGVRFWKLLGKLDERCDAHRAELRKAGEYVPFWAK